MQGYNTEIRHIPGKRNPADSLSRQQMADALVRKTSVTDANASYVQKLRVAENATDQEIQAALVELFNQGPQGSNKSISVQDQALTTNDQDGPQGQSIHASILASTAISKIQLDSQIKNSLSFALASEHPYSEYLNQLTGGMRQVQVNDLTFKILNSLLVVHDQKQDANLDFWRIVVPEDEEIREHIIRELHSTPYSAHPGIQRTVGRIRKSFF